MNQNSQLNLPLGESDYLTSPLAGRVYKRRSLSAVDPVVGVPLIDMVLPQPRTNPVFRAKLTKVNNSHSVNKRIKRTRPGRNS